MKVALSIFFIFLSFVCSAQTASEEDKFVSRLKQTDVPPGDLLSARSAVLFSPEYAQKELEEIQARFQQIGIDAVTYIESERALAGHDLLNSFASYFISREIKFLIFMKKGKEEYQFNFVLF